MKNRIKWFEDISVFLALIIGQFTVTAGITEWKWYFYIPTLAVILVILYIINGFTNDLYKEKEVKQMGIIQKFFNQETNNEEEEIEETAKEVEERLMKVIRKLYKQLEAKKVEIDRLRDNINDNVNDDEFYSELQ